jgi:hypothetical protein
MSAGGINYSGLTNYGKITLPSVESWGSDMNILRDPPKSISTRRVDKVGQTSEITQMVQDSGDRISGINDTILVYARGVNPMVAVSYDNFSNNGGQRSGGASMASLPYGQNKNTQAKLPYRIMNGGAFRPPIRDQRDLLPLSRLPRVWTSQFSQPGFADFSKKAMCPTPETQFRNIRKEQNMLRPKIYPQASFKLESPMIENFEPSYIVKKRLTDYRQTVGKTSLNSGVQTTTRFNGEFGVPTKQVVEKRKPEIIGNKKGLNMKDGGNNGDGKDNDYTENYIQRHTRNAYSVEGGIGTNISRDQDRTMIEDLFVSEASFKEPVRYSYEAPKIGYNQEMNFDEFHDKRSIELQNNRPNASMDNNVFVNRRNIEEEMMDNNRNYALKPNIHNNLGGFEPKGNMPLTYHENDNIEFDQHKTEMRKRVYDMQNDRTSMKIPYVPYEVSA